MKRQVKGITVAKRSNGAYVYASDMDALVTKCVSRGIKDIDISSIGKKDVVLEYSLDQLIDVSLVRDIEEGGEN